MEAYELNLPGSIQTRVNGGRVTRAWPLLMIFARTILFLMTGLLMIAILAATGNPDPLKAYLPWWPYQVIITNVLIYFVLKYLAGREGIGLGSLIGHRPGYLRKDLLQAAALLIPAFLFGMIGLYGTSFLLWGTMPPGDMFQPLPLLAAIAATILLPLTNGLVETTTYMGYALPRLEVQLGSGWAVTLAAVGLSMQHVAIPMMLDARFILWRLIAFLPLALFVAFIYRRMRRLTPLLIVHGLMDLQLVATILMLSLPQ